MNRRAPKPNAALLRYGLYKAVSQAANISPHIYQAFFAEHLDIVIHCEEQLIELEKLLEEVYRGKVVLTKREMEMIRDIVDAALLGDEGLDLTEGQSSAEISIFWELRGTNGLLKLCARAMYINYPPFLRWLEGVESGATTAPHRRWC